MKTNQKVFYIIAIFILFLSISAFSFFNKDLRHYNNSLGKFKKGYAILKTMGDGASGLTWINEKRLKKITKFFQGALDEAEKINDSAIIVGQLSPAPAEQLRAAIDMLKKKAKSACVVLAAADDNKVTLLAGVTDDLIEKGLKAGDIIKQIAPIVNGGGGGRPQFAQAGGKNPKKINDALTKAAEIIKSTLNN